MPFLAKAGLAQSLWYVVVGIWVQDSRWIWIGAIVGFFALLWASPGVQGEARRKKPIGGAEHATIALQLTPDSVTMSRTDQRRLKDVAERFCDELGLEERVIFFDYDPIKGRDRLIVRTNPAKVPTGCPDFIPGTR